MLIRSQVMRFSTVGALATAVHIVAGIFLISVSVPAEQANIGAFCVAVGFSFYGHQHYSFCHRNYSARYRFIRHICVALSCFAINQWQLIVLLSKTSLPDILSLAFATATTACLNYFALSKWVFGEHKAKRPASFVRWRWQ